MAPKVPPAPKLTDWFISGEGIEREVVSAEVQRFLGRDATVRPGWGTGEDEVRSFTSD